MSFRAWLSEYEGTADAVGFFADWMNKKSVIAGGELPELWESKISIKKWLQKRRAPKSIKFCFETVWIEYQNSKSNGVPVSAEPQLVTHPYVETVRMHYKSLYEEFGKDDTRTIEVRSFATPPAMVTVDVGITKNLRDYENVKARCALTIPCYREELDVAYEVAENWAVRRVQGELEKLEGKKSGPMPKLDLIPNKDEDKEFF